MQTQVYKMARSLDPTMLTASVNLNMGAPVIRSDGVVLNGNGRAMAIALAYNQGFDAATGYRQHLIDNAADFGLTPEAVKTIEQPILVRVIVGELDSEMLDSAIHSTIGGSDMSGLETANADAARLKISDFTDYDDNSEGDLTSRRNIGFVNKIIYRLAKDNERARYYLDDGSLSKDAVERVKRALFALAYNDNGLLERMTASTDEGAKNISNALISVAPNFAKLALQASQGIHHHYDFAATLATAVKRYEFVRNSEFPSVDVYFNQGSMFDRESPAVEHIMRFFDDNKRNHKWIKAFLLSIITVIKQQGVPIEMTLDGIPEHEPLSLDDVVLKAIEYANEAKGGGIGLFTADAANDCIDAVNETADTLEQESQQVTEGAAVDNTDSKSNQSIDETSAEQSHPIDAADSGDNDNSDNDVDTVDKPAEKKEFTFRVGVTKKGLSFFRKENESRSKESRVSKKEVVAAVKEGSVKFIDGWRPNAFYNVFVNDDDEGDRPSRLVVFPGSFGDENKLIVETAKKHQNIITRVVGVASLDINRRLCNIIPIDLSSKEIIEAGLDDTEIICALPATVRFVLARLDSPSTMAYKMFNLPVPAIVKWRDVLDKPAVDSDPIVDTADANVDSETPAVNDDTHNDVDAVFDLQSSAAQMSDSELLDTLETAAATIGAPESEAYQPAVDARDAVIAEITGNRLHLFNEGRQRLVKGAHNGVMNIVKTDAPPVFDTPIAPPKPILLLPAPKTHSFKRKAIAPAVDAVIILPPRVNFYTDPSNLLPIAPAVNLFTPKASTVNEVDAVDSAVDGLTAYPPRASRRAAYEPIPFKRLKATGKVVGVKVIRPARVKKAYELIVKPDVDDTIDAFNRWAVGFFDGIRQWAISAGSIDTLDAIARHNAAIDPDVLDFQATLAADAWEYDIAAQSTVYPPRAYRQAGSEPPIRKAVGTGRRVVKTVDTTIEPPPVTLISADQLPVYCFTPDGWQIIPLTR